MTKKRGSYKKLKPRRYPSRQKTTTKQGFNEYMRNLMRVRLDIQPSRFGKRGPIPKRVLVKDLLPELAKLKVVRGR